MYSKHSRPSTNSGSNDAISAARRDFVNRALQESHFRPCFNKADDRVRLGTDIVICLASVRE